MPSICPLVPAKAETQEPYGTTVAGALDPRVRGDEQRMANARTTPLAKGMATTYVSP